MAFILKYACIIRLILLLDKIMRKVKVPIRESGNLHILIVWVILRRFAIYFTSRKFDLHVLLGA